MAKEKVSKLIKKNIQKAVHLKTVGAYVQTPNPAIVGLEDDVVISSVDAKALYPTSMVYENIGYDTLYGRIYDSDIVEPLITKIKKINDDVKKKPSAAVGALNAFKIALGTLIKAYLKINKNIPNKKEFTELNEAYYLKVFEAIIKCNDFYSLFDPKTDRDYILLKSYLFPLLEGITWLSQLNPGYNKTIVDYLFYNDDFDRKYKNKAFYVFSKINSSETKFHIVGLESLKLYFLKNYSLNSYGTMFYKIPDKKSFEVDLILKGMDDRAIIKNQMLIIGAMNGSLNKYSDEVRESLKINGSLSDDTINSILDIIGDSNDTIRKKQFKALKGVQFDLQDVDSFDKMDKILNLMTTSRKSKQLGVKVTLNTGYGIYAMTTWNYANFLVSNSITSAGKIYGIKLFQQIAINVLDEIETNGFERLDLDE